MNEFMGLVFGAYDAKAEGFVPGGASLHNCMAGHGPDAETFERASNAELKPQYLDNTLAFMFETQLVVRPTEFAHEHAHSAARILRMLAGIEETVHAREPLEVNDGTTAIETLLAGLIDYAGLYPPASLDMRAAVENYRQYRGGKHAFALGRFIVDIDRVDELRAAAGEPSRPPAQHYCSGARDSWMRVSRLIDEGCRSRRLKSRAASSGRC